MVKFKFLHKSINNIKCLMKKTFMAKSSDETVRPTAAQKDEVNRGRCPKIGSVASASSAEGFIPLAARDSQWIGIAFYNRNFRSPLDEQDDAEEIELQHLSADTDGAISHLFPGLARNNGVVLVDCESTAEITKLLVGQKADFRGMKSSRKLLPTETTLSSVPEVPPQEEKIFSSSDFSTSATCEKKILTNVESSNVMYADDEEDEEDTSKRHAKRRKKKSDPAIMVLDASSASVFPVAKKPSSKLKQRVLAKRVSKTSAASSGADDEDDANKKTKEK